MLTPDPTGVTRDRGTADSVNASFYSRYPYRWPSRQFFRYDDAAFGLRFLNLDLGAFAEPVLPRVDHVWVAGCGANQAVETALLFPSAQVVGSDLSTTSLANADAIRRYLGIGNLTLRQESINEASHDSEFDFIICTGVIHHNAEPGHALAALVRAMRPDGILELMVYNAYHRIATQSVQESVRLLAGRDAQADLDMQARIARTLMELESEHLPGLPSGLLRAMRGDHESKVADAVIQPIEWTYNVSRLRDLCTDAGVSILLPRANDFDEAECRRWVVHLRDPELRTRYEAMTDTERWQLANVLLADRSPMLWFYCSKLVLPERYEQVINEQFLATRFVPAATPRTPFVLDGDRYVERKQHGHPVGRLPQRYAELRNAFDGRTPARDILARTGVHVDSIDAVTEARIDLVSRAHPRLVPVGTTTSAIEVR